MAVSEFEALMSEFYILEIGTWENYGGERVWRFMEGRYKEVLLYCFHVFCVCLCRSVSP